MKTVYHLDLTEKKIEGSKIAILTGDPFRVEKIAKKIDKGSKEIAWKREYRSYLSYFKDNPILVISTGIGGPSTSILIDELVQIGVEKFIRIGTTGAIQKNIEIGDVIITTGSVRLDGASTHYAPIEYPAVADFEITKALIDSAKKNNIKYHIGITCCSDTFYPGQERYDSASKYVIRRFKGTLSEWQKLGVLNYEMESATLFVVCSVLKVKAGCITGVIVNRIKNEKIKVKDLNKGEEKAIKVGIGALEFLIK